MALLVEQLLRPRYKVIASFWYNPFEIGQILLLYLNSFNNWAYTFDDPCGDTTQVLESDFSEYPHLFKKLEWWEGRKPEEMPQYVKWNYDPHIDDPIMKNHVRKVEGWEQAGYGVKINIDVIATKHWIPATEAEYNAYINKPS
jgi:hypothetical protein